MKLLYYSPASYGGIADYAHEQANALVDEGVEVSFLTTPDYPTHRQHKYHILPTLSEMTTGLPHFKGFNLLSPLLKRATINKGLKGLHYAHVTLSNIQTLVDTITQHSFRYVLLGSYAEYLAPLWTPSLRHLAQQDIIFGAILHDPVRDFVLGPQWWHRWSIASGYSFLRDVFVHEAIALDTIRPMPHLQTTVIPQGIYSFPTPSVSKDVMRSRLNLPLEANVILAFGHIRANKNLDKVIRAMADVPNVYLIVAGNELSSSHPLVPSYQALADSIGVSDRIRWHVHFIRETDIGNFFVAADWLALTYNQHFRSASATLNAATQYQKPCIASGGEGCLQSMVQNYDLGVWVRPDDHNAITQGLHQLLRHPLQPQWQRYITEQSWQNNALSVLNAFQSHHILNNSFLDINDHYDVNNHPSQ